MSDSSPFDDAPETQYEDAPVDQHEEKEEEEDDEDDEEEEEEQQQQRGGGVEVEEEDDPFADVPAPSAQSTQGSAPSLDDAFGAQANEPEPETALSIWERERADILRERQQKADSEKQQQISTAREEITKFYEDQEAKLEKTKKVNRADEKNYRNDTAAIFEKGTKWEKVNRLVNVAPKHGEKPGSSRVERYRKLLTNLKGEKDKPKKAAA